MEEKRFDDAALAQWIEGAVKNGKTAWLLCKRCSYTDHSVAVVDGMPYFVCTRCGRKSYKADRFGKPMYEIHRSEL